jgi:hypothetical protein
VNYKRGSEKSDPEDFRRASNSWNQGNEENPFRAFNRDERLPASEVLTRPPNQGSSDPFLSSLPLVRATAALRLIRFRFVPVSSVFIPKLIWFGHISVARADDQVKVETKLKSKSK